MEGDLKSLEGREGASLVGRTVAGGAFQAEGICRGLAEAKELGVTEEWEGQGGQNTRVRSGRTGIKRKVGKGLEGFINERRFGFNLVPKGSV